MWRHGDRIWRTDRRALLVIIAASDALSVGKSEADRTVCPTSIAKGSIQKHDPADLMRPGRALRHLETAHATKSREKGTENYRLQEGSWRCTRHARAPDYPPDHQRRSLAPPLVSPPIREYHRTAAEQLISVGCVCATF